MNLNQIKMEAFQAQSYLSFMLQNPTIRVVDAKDYETDTFDVLIHEEDVADYEAGYDAPLTLWECDGVFGFSYALTDDSVGLSYMEEGKEKSDTMLGAIIALAKFIFQQRIDEVVEEYHVEKMLRSYEDDKE